MIGIWARLLSPDIKNITRRRLNIVVQVRPFLSALPSTDVLGTKNVATVSIVNVSWKNYMNGMRQKSSL